MIETSNIPRPWPICVGLVLALLGAVDRAAAGGGPENVLLVVNANRDDSKQVANHYVRLRDLPASNVVYLDYTGSPEKIDGKTFREQILGPVLMAIDRRGLSAQIDVIAYSCGFPWQIDLRGDFPEGARPPRVMTPIASITGATFFWHAILSKQPTYLTSNANHYAVGVAPTNTSKCKTLVELPTQSFRGRYRWLSGGKRTNDQKQGRRYLLSTMLGVTTGRGNTVAEILRCLDRSVQSEERPPTGVFCYVKNDGIRSKTRDACYPAAATQLIKLGARAAVERGTLPRPGTKVSGMMLGAARLGLKAAKLQIEPGAICEHLTSSAGDLSKGAAQTALTELIRAGATGSSGTVEEPFALQWKFPLPALHVHYRRGCSLAEAYYLSVGSPYQLLIAGDPLCQPWAPRPSLQVEGWPSALPKSAAEGHALIDFGKPLADPASASAKGPVLEGLASLAAEKRETQQGSELSAPPPGSLRLIPVVTSKPPTPGTAYWELYIDGRLRLRLPSGKGATFPMSELGPGWHDLRCVGVGAGPLEAQRRLVGSFENGSQTGETSQAEGNEPVDPSEVPAEENRVTLELSTPTAPFQGSVDLKVQAPGADRIVLLHNRREVGRLTGPLGEIRVDASMLGRGPVRLQARAEPTGARSAPHWVTIE